MVGRATGTGLQTVALDRDAAASDACPLFWCDPCRGLLCFLARHAGHQACLRWLITATLVQQPVVADERILSAEALATSLAAVWFAHLMTEGMTLKMYFSVERQKDGRQLGYPCCVCMSKSVKHVPSKACTAHVTLVRLVFLW